MYSTTKLEIIDRELASCGMRRASEDEAGFYVLTSQGRVWATDYQVSEAH